MRNGRNKRDWSFINPIICLVAIVAISVILSIGIVCCMIAYDNNTILEKTDVIGTVVDKEYIAGRTAMIYTGKAYMPIVYNEKYYVTIEYENVHQIFDDQTVFQRYQEGDRVQLILVRRYSKNRRLLSSHLTCKN